MSETRINLPRVAPDAYRALGGVETYIRGCGLEPSLIDLIKVRASQINHCVYCIDKHSRDAREVGETEQRLYLLNAWREAPFYSQRERAALEWTEHLTRLPTNGAPSVVYDQLRGSFSDVEVANLTVLIGMINLWNRIGVGFHSTPPSVS
jgi:AhpD family alkylhydroperoxidase